MHEASEGSRCLAIPAAVAKLIKTLAAALALVAGLSPAPCPAAPGGTASDFIGRLGDQALAVLRSGASLDEKESYFRQVLRQDFDLAGISRFILGPYWRLASESQRREFRRLLEDSILRSDGKRLARYGGEGFRVTGSRADADDVIVTSQITRALGPPIEIDWRLGVSDGFYKISDLAIEGVSMALTRRTEFAAVIQRDGGQVEGLLARLRQEAE